MNSVCNNILSNICSFLEYTPDVARLIVTNKKYNQLAYILYNHAYHLFPHGLSFKCEGINREISIGFDGNGNRTVFSDVMIRTHFRYKKGKLNGWSKTISDYGRNMIEVLETSTYYENDEMRYLVSYDEQEPEKIYKVRPGVRKFINSYEEMKNIFPFSIINEVDPENIPIINRYLRFAYHRCDVDLSNGKFPKNDIELDEEAASILGEEKGFSDEGPRYNPDFNIERDELDENELIARDEGIHRDFGALIYATIANEKSNEGSDNSDESEDDSSTDSDDSNEESEAVIIHKRNLALKEAFKRIKK